MYRRIRELREDAGLKQAEIAKIRHCSQACDSYYETGKRDIATGTLILLALF